MDDGIGDAVGLEGGDGEWYLAVQDLEQGLQLYEFGAGFRGARVE